MDRAGQQREPFERPCPRQAGIRKQLLLGDKAGDIAQNRDVLGQDLVVDLQRRNARPRVLFPIFFRKLDVFGQVDQFGLIWESRFFERRMGCRSEEHTSELQSLMRISYAVFCLKKKKTKDQKTRSPKTTQRITTKKRHCRTIDSII